MWTAIWAEANEEVFCYPEAGWHRESTVYHCVRARTTYVVHAQYLRSRLLRSVAKFTATIRATNISLNKRHIDMWSLAVCSDAFRQCKQIVRQAVNRTRLIWISTLLQTTTHKWVYGAGATDAAPGVCSGWPGTWAGWSWWPCAPTFWSRRWGEGELTLVHCNDRQFTYLKQLSECFMKLRQPPVKTKTRVLVQEKVWQSITLVNMRTVYFFVGWDCCAIGHAEM